MKGANPNAYLEVAFSEIPRVLSLLDRNPFSKTFGCFHRSFWLHRTSDFPTAINQMGAHILALVYKHPFEKNPYHQNEKILQLCIASIKYWMTLQHKDGSFDEWYPNERGWAGPTGYLIHAMVDSYFILGDEFPEDLEESFKEVIHKSGRFLASYNEEFILANHHAIALLPIYEAYLLTKDATILEGYHRKFKEFEKYCYEEGWSLEYDGVDIGYLSGTISFLSRLHRHDPQNRIEEIVNKAVEFTSYHLYPNGFFGGSMGSRQTGHFYHFGYEYWASKNPLAAKMAEMGLKALDEGKLVSPGVQEDHYVLYRISEYLESHLSYQKRSNELPLLPWEGANFQKYFQDAGIFIKKQDNLYLVVNLKRGGVIKAFDCYSKKIIVNDCGWIAKLDNNDVATSQWNDPQYETKVDGDELSIIGEGNYMVMKTFTPIKMIIFRMAMLLFGWHSTLAYKIKALIRSMMMVGTRRAPISFKRSISVSNNDLKIKDEWNLVGGLEVKELYIGDEIPIRYVPQSRYFQMFELSIKGEYLSDPQIGILNQNKKLTNIQKIKF